MKYYIIDFGKEMRPLAELIFEELRSITPHITVFLTDCDKDLMVSELTEDEFLEIHKAQNN